MSEATPSTPAPTDFAARAEWGRAARRRLPRGAHATWDPPAGRTDPITLLEEQAATRVSELVPLRHARMMASPLNFYRGAALLMASDLATMPNTGIDVQLCGDAHLSNFGVFGTPERRLIFDINDFDETLPGPWEWDLKRLVASFEVAGRQHGFDDEEREAVDRAVVKGYRERMSQAAASRVLDAWYDRLDADDLAEWVSTQQKAQRLGKDPAKRTQAVLAKARKRDSRRGAAKYVTKVDGRMRIIADPPFVVPLEDLRPAERTEAENDETARAIMDGYRTTLTGNRHPIAEFDYVHMARRVGGVGSVGTRSWIVLLRGRDDDDPLLLQAKQAEASVLERFLPPSEFAHHGERVVRGQQLMQAASDLFLGWQRVAGDDGVERDFYLRQLHDWKGDFDVDDLNAKGARIYADVCGQTLARAHARSGDRVAIAAYLGSNDTFDEALARFADAYADQNERDFAAFTEAVASGRLAATPLD
ncbi:DUF2252 domain-containing protein [Agromyces sp. Leaf222]|uniref:DUF2252 domain-containing protein n=1 Tax=Agromyces sp. Leaf222 TaxID=1735688 RepID=UPI0007011A45|nr:DUF2252 domain-containing protein [Agromyces sp. Leaf222]KQM81503.1 hypothetical protein ASE68_17290 [Agromyces sp. Leaf222]